MESRHEHQGSDIRFRVDGSPIGGENPPRDGIWRAEVASAAAGMPRSDGVRLDFVVEPHRRIDLDNLVRPALAGLRDAGVCVHGYARMDALVASKRAGHPAGLEVHLAPPSELLALPTPGRSIIEVDFSGLPDRVDDRREWQRAVADAWWPRPAFAGETFIDVEISTNRSLEGLMKPLIDGLTPCLGRDPFAGPEFAPNDHLLTWLRFQRVPGSTLKLRFGARTDA